MSERTYAPRSGGRAAERDGRNDRVAGQSGDTRRTGTGRDQATRKTDPARDEVRNGRAAGGSRNTDRETRGGGRVSEGGRVSGSRIPESRIPGSRGGGRAKGEVRGDDRVSAAESRTASARRTKGRETDSVRRENASTRRDTDAVRRSGSVRRDSEAVGRVSEGTRRTGGKARTAEALGRAGRRSEVGRRSEATRRSVAGRGAAGRGPVEGGAVGRGPLGGRGEPRGRRPEVDAPVAGTAALQIDLGVVEPERVVAQPATAPRLQVAPPAPISAPRAPFVAGVIGVVIVGVLGILLINTKTNENSFKIADLRKQGAILDNQKQDLDNQLADVSSPGNLDAAARRLGLVKADHPALIRLPDGKVIGVLTPADGSPSVTAQKAQTGSAADEDKGAANIIPDGTATTPGLTPNSAPAGTTATGTGTTGTGTTGTSTTGTGTTGTSTTGTSTNGTTQGVTSVPTTGTGQ